MRIKNSTYYRKQIFVKILQYIKKKENINNIIIAGGFNENIIDTSIQNFFIELGVEDIHTRFNNI